MAKLPCLPFTHQWVKSRFQFQALNNPPGVFDLALICRKCGKDKHIKVDRPMRIKLYAAENG